MMILIFDEFASIEFSKSSLRTDDGLWTTSPAAILLETSVGKILIISGINQLGKLLDQNQWYIKIPKLKKQ